MKRGAISAMRAGVCTLAGWALLSAAGCGRVDVDEDAARFDPSYPIWNVVLARFTVDGRVDYERLHAHHQFVEMTANNLRSVTREEFDGWPAGERLAFLINAHNVFALARIVERYPVDTLEATDPGWGSARGVRDIYLLGRRWSLRELAKEATSDRYLDARAAFLLNWGEAGCAPLPPVAVTGANLTDLLDRQTRRFLSDERNCRYNVRGAKIELAPVLKMFRRPIRRDFTTVWDFLMQYLPPDVAAAMEARRPVLEWMAWDGSLSEAKR
jgi:hypothetical protein